MSTVQTQEINSISLDDTLVVAKQIGSRLKGGEVIELISDLGGGKTAFVRGLTSGMGSTDTVRSPSFTLSNQYIGNGLTLHHYDFYRLDEPGIMSEELKEVLEDPKAVVAVEWASLVNDVLPPEHLTISLVVDGENSRRIIAQYPSTLNYLFPHNT